MGFHGSSSGVNVHVPHRWEVLNETERLSINVNPDGTAISENNGMNCLCLQVEDGSYWRVSGLNPVVWNSVSGATSGGSSSTSATARKILFSVHAPADTPFPLNNDFGNIYMNRLAPNIRYNFDRYANSLWEISETEHGGDTVNYWSDEQFATYNDLLAFLNNNLSNGEGIVAYSFTITCYNNELINIDPFKRMLGINKFFSVLRGGDNYRSTGYDSKTINSSNNWDHLQNFVEDVYNRFLGGGATPILSEALNTFWFPQSPKRMYDHHHNNINFPSGNASARRYFSVPTNDTVMGVGSGSWNHVKDEYYIMHSDSMNFYHNDNNPQDQHTSGNNSLIRVSMYYSNGDSSKVMFYVKPVGVDTFYMGFHPELKKKSYALYAEYESPTRYKRIRKIRDVAFNNQYQNYGMNTSVRVESNQFINEIVSPNLRSHIRTHSVIGKVRFLLISSDGTCIKSSRCASIFYGNKIINSYVLLK